MCIRDRFLSSDEKSFQISTTPTTRGQNGYPSGPYRPARYGNPNPHFLVVDWIGLMKPARDESCPSEHLGGSAAPGDDIVSSSDEKSFQTSTTSTTQEKRGDTPGQYRSAWCGNPNPHCLVANWMGLMEPARGENCPLRQRQGNAAPGEDKFPSPDEKSFQISTAFNNPGTKRRSPGSIPPRAV